MFNTKIVPVLVIKDVETARPLGKLLLDSGLPVAEITLRTDAALESIRIMREIDGLLVGAGTVLNVENAKQAVEAGAEFLVSPGMVPEVISYAKSVGVPIIPGVATATEMATADGLGLDLVKFFPAEAAGGAPFVKAIGSVYPNIKVMPTGGITPDNVGDYLKLSNVKACGGSWMVPASDLTAGNYDKISNMVKEAVNLTQA